MPLRSMSIALPSILVLLAACGPQQPQSSAPPVASEPAPPAVPQPPVATVTPAAPGATAAPPPAAAATTAAHAAGEKVFRTYCLTCHGAKGEGDGPAAVALNPKPANFATGAFKYDTNGNGIKGDVEDIKVIVHDGAAKHGGSPLMTPWPMLSAEQLQAVAQYVKAFHAG